MVLLVQFLNFGYSSQIFKTLVVALILFEIPELWSLYREKCGRSSDCKR